MTNISQKVNDYLNKNYHIVKSLEEGIINVRGLAYSILKKTNLKASLDSVMTGIRRYQTTGPKKQDINCLLKESRISTKSRLVLIEIERHLKILSTITTKILNNIHVSKGEVFRIIGGRQSIIIIIDQSKKREILQLIPEQEIISVKEGFGEISIHFPENHGDMPGLFSPVVNELGVNHINIIEIIGGFPEILIIINEKDISRCHDVLLRFFYGEDYEH